VRIERRGVEMKESGEETMIGIEKTEDWLVWCLSPGDEEILRCIINSNEKERGEIRGEEERRINQEKKWKT
jgi:hypothetical protein